MGKLPVGQPLILCVTRNGPQTKKPAFAGFFVFGGDI